MTAGIYIFKHLETGKQYIGQSIDLDKRIKQHLRDVRRRKYKCPKFYKALRKYPEECWEIRRIEFKPEMMAFLKENLDLVEKALIGLYQTAGDKGYNLTFGGDGGAKSEETKRKISEALKGQVRSEEHRTKLSEAQKGKVLSEETKRRMSEAQKGRVHSDESKRKMSASQKGKVLSEEHRTKLSEAAKGRVLTEETKRRMSEAKKNMSAETKRRMSEAQKGRVHSEETKRKLSEAKRKLTPEQVQQVFQMRSEGLLLREIASHFSVSQRTICSILRGELYKDLQQTK